MPETTFTLEHDEQTWRVQLSQGGKDYAIRLTKFGTGKITVQPFPHQERFFFQQSDPNTVLAIGRLLIEAARKAGATDA